MSFELIRKIPTVDEILTEMPLSDELKEVKAERDQAAIDIFTGNSNKFMLIIGPCSADREDAVSEYCERLAKLNEQVKDVLFLIPRIYTNKPRTTGEGYKGMAHQPDPNAEPHIVDGLKAIRQMHIRILKETHLSAADEMLYPENYPYLEDVLTYVAIGARSVENQQHRLTVSGLDIPIGLKNPTSGDMNVLLNSIQAAQAPHTFIYKGWEVKTSGNPYAHSILRGAFNPFGQNIPNFHYEDLTRYQEMYLAKNFQNPAIIVDVSHANCGKVFSEQPRVAMEVLQSMERSDGLNQMIKGLMIESYLEEGNQKVDGGIYGKSITDPCLGWGDSQQLVLKIADFVSKLK